MPACHNVLRQARRANGAIGSPEEGIAMRILKLGIALSMLLATSLPGLAAPAPTAKPLLPPTVKQLSPKDIKAQFGTGKAINGVSLPSDHKYTLLLKADGTAEMTLAGDKSPKTGTWRVSKTGYCSKWGTQAEHCYNVQPNGKQYDVVDDTGKVVAHWTKA
jgi:hypothetical protein